MIIVTDKKIYVQKYDIKNLFILPVSIPASVFEKAYDNNIKELNKENMYEFIEFEEDNEINFFNKIDWIINFNEVDKLSISEILSLMQTIVTERIAISKLYNSLDDKNKKNNINLVTVFKELEYKLFSLNDMILYKQGKLNFDIPTKSLVK